MKINRSGLSLVILLVFFFTNGISQNAPVTTTGIVQACPSGSILVPVTVDNFSNIGSISLRIEYDPAVLSYLSSVNINSNLSGIVIHDYAISAALHKVSAIWFNTAPLSLPNGTKLFDLSFTYVNGSTTLAFNNTSNNGIDCEYSDPSGNPLNDLPTSNYFINGNASTKQVPTAGNIEGVTSVCQGQNNVNYSISPLQNATSYVWSVPLGATIISGSGSTSIYVNFANNASSGAVSVYGTNICGNGTPSPDLVITVNSIPADPGPISGSSVVCAGQSGEIYSIPTVSNAIGYFWTVPSGATITSGNNTQVITVGFGPSASSGNITVYGTNNCGNSPLTTSFPLTVNPIQQVSLNIAASENPVCTGTNVTFTASPTNGGSSPSYQWKVNGQNVGTNSQTFAHTPANNDIVTCILTSNISCPGGNPATSNSIIMGVIENSPVSITIAASENPICSGTSVTFIATPTNGGSSPIYQWKVNGSNVGTNSPNFSYTPLNNDIITCVLTSNATCATGSPATSNAIFMVVNPNLPVSVSIVESANAVCSGSSVTFTATPTNPGSVPVYQWKVNGSNVGSSSSQYSYAPSNNDAVSCVLTSNATCPQGNPATSNTVTMVIHPILSVSVSVAASSNPVCNGTQVTFTASPTNGGSSPSYQWKVNGNTAGTNNSLFSYTTVNTDVVTCILTSNATCATGSPATSNAVTMVVNSNIPVSVSIAAASNPACSGNQVNFTATPTNGGSAPTYQWKVNGTNAGTNNPVFSYIPANNDQVTCLLTSDLTCASGNPATSNLILMTVNPNLPVSIAISASANSVCAGTSVTFSTTATNAGISPVYQWKVNGNNAGSNSASFAYVPSNNDIVTCTLTSSVACPVGNPAVSNQIDMVVYPILPVSIAIAASGNPVCSGTSVTFTGTPSNGGSTPVYQWKVNGSNVGTNSPNYSYTPANNDIITCVLTSNATCATGSPATSNAISMVVNPNLPVSVSIVESANALCSGSSVTFTATSTNPGSAPVYQWKVNGSNVGTNSYQYSYTPSNNDAVSCVLTSNATCPQGNPATSNTVTMVVNPILPVSVSIATSSNPVCNGTQVTFTASPTNGGSSPFYQWKVNSNPAGTNNSLFSYTPVNNDVVTCILTSNATCATGSPATSNAVTMVVNSNIPVSVSIAASSNPACSGNQVNFTATPTNGGITPVYQWKVNGTNAGTNNPVFYYIPANNDQVTCLLTSDLTCASGNPATSNSILMSVNPNLLVSVSLGASVNPVCSGTSVLFTATTTNAGSAPVYQWKVNESNVGTNSSQYSYIPSNNDAVSCVLTSNATCATGNPATSNIIYIIVNQNPVIPTGGASIPSPTQIIWNWNPVAGATGYKWNTSNDYITATNLGTTTTTTETGLTCSTVYTRYVWAYNVCGYSAPVSLNQTTSTCSNTCGSPITVNHTVSGGVAPVVKTAVYGTVTNIPGEPSKCWITSNLGSDHQATAVSDATEASAGWYWQFNRKQGYKNDGITRTPNSIWTTTISEDFDWQEFNDPCSIELGSSWRIPTYTEWNNLWVSGSWSNWSGPWSSDLKLHAAGYLGTDNGLLYSRGGNGYYWSNTQSNTANGWRMSFMSSGGSVGIHVKAYGFSIRCLNALISTTTPTVTTSPISNISQSYATGGGHVTSDGGVAVTARGVCWATSQNPTISDSFTIDGSGLGIFTSALGGLNTSTTYYVRSYATNGNGTAYGDQLTFTTLDPCTEIPTIIGSSAVCTGTINSIYTTEPGMTNYQWNITGGIISSGGGENDNFVNINWGIVGIGMATVAYNEVNCLGTKTVTINPLPTPTISGPISTIIGFGSVTYITQPNMTSYTWSISSGGTITAGAGTNSVSVTWNSQGNQTISVNYYNSNQCTAANSTTLTITVYPPGQSSNCVNSDFSLGNFMNWTGCWGFWCSPGGGNRCTNPYVTFNPPCNNPNQPWISTPNGGNYIITPAPGGPDPYIPAINTVFPGDAYSACLGKRQIPGGGGYVDQLKYQITYDPTNSFFTYRFAAVLDNITDPTHNTPDKRPRFTVEIIDHNTGILLDPICGFFDVYPGDGQPGWSVTGTRQWKNWSSIGIDLSNLSGITPGQLLDVVFTTHGCPWTAHTAYAYISAVCEQMEISMAGCLGANQVVLTAPPGYSTYTWTGPICGTCTPTVTTGQTRTVMNANSGDVYRLDLLSWNGCQVKNIFTTINFTVITPSFERTINCAGNLSTFLDNSTVTQNQIVSHHWDFGDGNNLTTSANPVTHLYATPGTYTVTLTAVSTEGCTASVTQTFNVGPPPSFTGPLTNKTICSGEDVNIVLPLPVLASGTWSTTTTGNVTINANPSNHDGTAIHDILINNGTTPATVAYTIYAHIESCFNILPGTLTVTVLPSPVPSITGSNTACVSNDEKTYITEPGAQSNSYTWSIIPPGAGTITSGSGTNNITVTWLTAGTHTITVNYITSNGCAAAAPSTKTVNVYNRPIPAISGITSISAGSAGVTYSTETGMTNYAWSISSGGTITAGIGTNVVTVTWNLQGTQWVSVNYNDVHGCNSLTPTIFPVNVTSTIPATRSVTNIIIGSGQTNCYNASQTISIAGNGTLFIVLSGGNATFIAGQKISYFPGTTIYSGGYMWGYIAPIGPYCLTPSLPAVITTENETTTTAIEQASFRIYPNPTTGNFILEIIGRADQVEVDIYGVWGDKVLSASLNGERKHELSLDDKPVGVYFIRIVSGANAETIKIIKQ